MGQNVLSPLLSVFFLNSSLLFSVFFLNSSLLLSVFFLNSSLLFLPFFWNFSLLFLFLGKLLSGYCFFLKNFPTTGRLLRGKSLCTTTEMKKSTASVLKPNDSHMS